MYIYIHTYIIYIIYMYSQVPNCRGRGGGCKLHFSEILHTHFHLLTPPLIMYFMQKVIPPILEKQRQICPEHNNL